MIKTPKGHLMVNYLGLRGAGKTLSAVHEEVLPRYLNGEKIVSTSFLNLKGVDIIYTPEDCLKLRNCVLFIDELGDFVDAYDWLNIPQAFRRFLRLSRKRKVDIITTAQDLSYIAKPFRVLFSHWVFCQNNSFTGVFGRLLNSFGFSNLKILQQELTSNDLFLLQNGVGHKVLLDDDPVDVSVSSGEDLTENDLNLVSDVSKLSKTKIKHYNNRKLICSNLDDKKIYQYASYCSKCQTIIDYLDDEICYNAILFKKNKKPYFCCSLFCPNCETLLKPKKMGIYDSDFEIPLPEVPDLVFKPFVPSPKGERLIPYKGPLSSAQKPPKA